MENPQGLLVDLSKETNECGDISLTELLEVGRAWIEIKPTGNGDQLGLYIEDICVFVPELPTYTACAEKLIEIMNAY